MKSVYLTIMMLTAVFMLLLPLTAGGEVAPVETLPVMGEVVESETKEPTVKVLISKSGKVETFLLADYLFGVVAAEMPALYEEEALKAQAVAAYTYFLGKKESNLQKDYDITDDYTVDQAFITKEAANEKWGSSAVTYKAKISAAVNDVFLKKVTYNGKPATTVYHAISFGKTENAADVWGGEYPYLVSVDSSFDKLDENYISTKTFSATEINALLSEVVTVTDTTKNCFTNITRTKAGSVKSLTVNGVLISGNDLRAALNLRSPDFDISFENGEYTFTVRGYGHSIGMSQNGANYLAKQGKTWEEILLHYYSGCKIE